MRRSSIIFVILLLTPGLFSQEIKLEEGLLLYLPFNGNATDESGNNILTDPNDPKLTPDRHGNPDQAFLFDGFDDYISLNNNQALITTKQFTICMWARIDGRSNAEYSPSNTLFEQRDQDNGDPNSIHFNGELNGICYIGITSSTFQTGRVSVTYPGDHQWNHFLCMLDENDILSIYFNGKLQGSTEFQNDGDFVTGVTTVKIGSHNPDHKNYGAFYGAIDEVYIYKRALKPCEIEALYAGQLLKER